MQRIDTDRDDASASIASEVPTPQASWHSAVARWSRRAGPSLKLPLHNKKYKLKATVIDKVGHHSTACLIKYLRDRLNADVDTTHVASNNSQVALECGNIAAAAASLALSEAGRRANFSLAAVGANVDIRRDNQHFKSLAVSGREDVSRLFHEWAGRILSDKTEELSGHEIYALVKRDHTKRLLDMGVDVDEAESQPLPIPVEIKDFQGLVDLIAGSYSRGAHDRASAVTRSSDVRTRSFDMRSVRARGYWHRELHDDEQRHRHRPW